jgi:hypothetical protein
MPWPAYDMTNCEAVAAHLEPFVIVKDPGTAQNF